MTGLVDQVAGYEGELAEVEARLADPAVFDDHDRYADLARRHKELERIVACGRHLRARAGDLAAAREMAADAAGDDRDLMVAEAAAAEADVERLTAELRLLLLPPDPNDHRDVIVEIRGAEGGEEANLFAADLFGMYKTFAADQGWKVEVLGAEESALGGYATVTFRVAGDGVWTRLKHEAGPHRVQRVPVTESAGRVHTSSATVTVLPEADEVDVDIDAGDLKIDVYRSSGPGGQSVNTTDSAVRITHLPTGLVVSMQDEKSQIQNRARALVVLRSRLLALAQAAQAAEASDARRGQVGGGGRSEKIRTYNFKENRVTDHRIKLTAHRLDQVLQGDLDEFTEAITAEDRRRALETATA
jgi:peptide chain release factor 1